MEEIRLNKYLAMCGICSRRDADKLIEAGKVTVDGNIATSGQKVTEASVVQVEGRLVKLTEKKVVLAFNKPRGVVVSERDDHADVLVMDLIDYPIRLTYAGRLDKDSEGLLLLTNDGDFINAVMKGRSGHEKEYIVTTDKSISDNKLRELERGIYIPDLQRKTRPCRIKVLSDRTYSFLITEGLNRQIRRMVAYADAKVKTLKRVRIVNIKLGDLKPGEYRELNDNELVKLYDSVGLKWGGKL